MFHKPNSSTLGGKKDAPLRKSDRRKLRDRLLETLFSGESKTNWIAQAEKLIDDAIVGSGDVLCRKLKLQNEHVTLFLRTGCSCPSTDVSREAPIDMDGLMDAFPTSWPYQTTQPIVLEYEDSERKLHLIPLISLLSALPPPPPSPPLNNEPYIPLDETIKKYRIPNLTIHPAVSKYICRGADLMKSGIRSFPPPWELRQSKGVVSISIIGNPQVLAVGFIEKCLFREYCYRRQEDWKSIACGLVGPETKGVGVTILNCYGDDLWKSGLPSKALGSGVVNPLGGGRYDDGNYGNVGFQEGKRACPILPVKVEEVSSDDEEEDAEDASDDVCVDHGNVVVSMDQLDISEPEQEEGKQSDISCKDTIENEAAKIKIDHNEILEAAFFTSLIHILISKTPLPIPISTYSAKHLMAAVPQSGPRLDLKQTKHKKIGPFLAEMESQGVIKLGPSKDKKDRCAFLVGIEKHHPDLITFKRHLKKEMEESGQDLTAIAGVDTKKKLAVVDLFIVPRHICDGMQLREEDVKAINAKTEERRGTGYLTKTECRAIVEGYIENEDLVDRKNKGKILVNGPLCDALYRPSKKNKTLEQGISFPTFVSRKDLIEQWISKMDTGHALVEMPGSKILKLARGEPKSVDIEVEFRQGNRKKFLTRLRGMEEYGIDAEVLSNDVSQRFACSSNVETNPVGRPALKKGRAELVFQGTNIVKTHMIIFPFYIALT